MSLNEAAASQTHVRNEAIIAFVTCRPIIIVRYIGDVTEWQLRLNSREIGYLI